MLKTDDPRHRGGDLLAIGFGVTVLLWAVMYVGLAPVVDAPPLLMAMIACAGLIGAGVALGRWSDRPVTGGVRLGLLMGLVNTLIVASLQGGESPMQAVRDGMIWAAGFTLLAVALCAAGTWLGMRIRRANSSPISWTSWFALIVAVTTVPLIVSGGIVTGLEAGLDVPDWLTTFGYPMMFYPMAMMQADSGVYAEHFHRLWGLLVGLSVIFLVVHLFRVDSRAWVKWVSVAVLVAVCVQGVLGAAWVLDTQARLLAVMHGVFGQTVFATLAAIAAFTSVTWLSRRERSDVTSIGLDHKSGGLLLGALIAQLALGALYRHLRREAGDATAHIEIMFIHIVFAFIVAALALFVGGRALGTHGDQPILPRLGRSLIVLIGLQIVLGFVALIAVLHRGDAVEIPVIEVITTTLHQATGAVILALAALIVAWNMRLLKPRDPDKDAAAVTA